MLRKGLYDTLKGACCPIPQLQKPGILPFFLKVTENMFLSKLLLRWGLKVFSATLFQMASSKKINGTTYRFVCEPF